MAEASGFLFHVNTLDMARFNMPRCDPSNNHAGDNNMTVSHAKKPVAQDWHPADIKAALHKKGITLAGLAAAYGMTSSSSLSSTFTRSYPLNEKRIADAIGLHPMFIWPSRYNKDGSVKPRGFRALQFNATAMARNSKTTAADSRKLKAA
jgi:Ner family transcriptional regulator